jgi:hypothetical protein
MTPKVSRIMLVFEAALIALPITALAVVGSNIVYSSRLSHSGELIWQDFAVRAHAVAALVAIVAGWYLLVVGIRGGAEALRRTHLLWWVTAGIGAASIAAAWFSLLLPPAPEYTPEASFRELMWSSILATPLLFVLAHLWAERQFRK